MTESTKSNEKNPVKHQPKARVIFQVFIGKKEYDVYSIPKELKTPHKGYNNIFDEWWLYFSDRVPDGILPPLDSTHFIPFSSSINRTLWDIQIKGNNSHKIKWDEHRFSSSYSIEMWCNKKLVYQFGTFNLDFAMQKIGYLKVVLQEHVYNFFEPEKEKGRLIYYYGLPATVDPREGGEIGIIPDYSDIPKEEWWKEYDRRRSRADGKEDLEWKEIEKDNHIESMSSDYINWGDALSDGNIDWFRKK